MKQKIIFILLFVFLGGIIGYVCVAGYYSHQMQAAKSGSSKVSENGQLRTLASGGMISSVTEDEEEDASMREQETMARIDYPLLDLYFESDKTYKIAVIDYMDQTVVKEYEEKGNFFQFNKEYISILTCPAGRGTTPPYIFCIYEGDERIKDLDCFEVRPGILDGKWGNQDE